MKIPNLVIDPTTLAEHEQTGQRDAFDVALDSAREALQWIENDIKEQEEMVQSNLLEGRDDFARNNAVRLAKMKGQRRARLAVVRFLEKKVAA